MKKWMITGFALYLAGLVWVSMAATDTQTLKDNYVKLEEVTGNKADNYLMLLYQGKDTAKAPETSTAAQRAEEIRTKMNCSAVGRYRTCL